MSFRIRAARAADLQALYEMAKLTGGGFTNLPPERDALRAKLARSHAAFARDEETLADDLFVLVLENAETGEVRGTCQIFTHVGQHWPFYSYCIGTLTKHSEQLNRPRLSAKWLLPASEPIRFNSTFQSMINR